MIFSGSPLASAEHTATMLGRRTEGSWAIVRHNPRLGPGPQ